MMLETLAFSQSISQAAIIETAVASALKRVRQQERLLPPGIEARAYEHAWASLATLQDARITLYLPLLVEHDVIAGLQSDQCG